MAESTLDVLESTDVSKTTTAALTDGSGYKVAKTVVTYADATPSPVNVTTSTPLPTVDSAGNALLTTIDADTSALAACASGSELQVDVITLPALATGTNTIGTVGLAPQTSGGLTIARLISAATTNATSVKASAGQVFGYFIGNLNASPIYFKLYDKASAPTVGTDTPAMTIMIPGGSAANVEWTNGIAFSTGIAYAITAGITDADTTAVSASEQTINLLYK